MRLRVLGRDCQHMVGVICCQWRSFGLGLRLRAAQPCCMAGALLTPLGAGGRRRPAAATICGPRWGHRWAVGAWHALGQGSGGGAGQPLGGEGSGGGTGRLCIGSRRRGRRGVALLVCGSCARWQEVVLHVHQHVRLPLPDILPVAEDGGGIVQLIPPLTCTTQELSMEALMAVRRALSKLHDCPPAHKALFFEIWGAWASFLFFCPRITPLP